MMYAVIEAVLSSLWLVLSYFIPLESGNCDSGMILIVMLLRTILMVSPNHRG
jgi:hypothetical protein